MLRELIRYVALIAGQLVKVGIPQSDPEAALQSISTKMSAARDKQGSCACKTCLWWKMTRSHKLVLQCVCLCGAHCSLIAGRKQSQTMTTWSSHRSIPQAGRWPAIGGSWAAHSLAPIPQGVLQLSALAWEQLQFAAHAAPGWGAVLGAVNISHPGQAQHLPCQALLSSA